MTKLIALWTSFFLTAFLAAGFQNTLSAQVNTYCETKVGRIDIRIQCPDPHLVFDSSTLLTRLRTKTGTLFHQNDFDTDLKSLANEFDRVEPHLEFIGNEVYICLDIWLKPHIHSICWSGNHCLSTKKLEKELAIDAGTVFERHCFNEAFHKLKAFYIKEGFFEAELNYEVKERPGCNEVDIHICIQEGRAGRIKKICFQGLDKEEEEEALALMVSKEYCFFTSWFTDKGLHNQEAIEHDRCIILNYLHNEGYADARVEIDICDCPQDKGKILIKVIAYKGQRYFFGNITFCGNTLFTTAQLEECLCLFSGDPFSPDKLREAVRNINFLCGAKGHIEASASYISRLRECQNVYDVEFNIHEGELFRIGLVKVFGNSCTKTSVILHESLLVPGEIFDYRLLEATQLRLDQIGYFKCVNVYPVRSLHNPDLCGNYRDVHIEVEETTTGNFGLFFGFSTLDSIFGGVEITEKNFRSAGLLDLGKHGFGCLRGGGEYLQFRVSIGAKISSYLLKWTKPYFMDTKWIIGFDLERSHNRSVSDDYDIETIGLRLHAAYPLNQFLRFGLHYRLRYNYIALSGDSTDNPEFVKTLKHNGIVSAFGPSLCYDSTDSAIKPSKGLRSELALEFAGLGGEFKFLSLSYLNTFYMRINCRGIMKYRLDFKFIQPLWNTHAGDIPLGERYFLGGENTVRGYRNFIIGPKLTSQDPEGGISSFLISEEYLHHIWGCIDAFAFIDAGSISLGTYHIGPIRASYGCGLRIEVLNNIPVIVGMGWPINAESRSDVRRFFISMGGRF